ncbi:MAG: hypothetical protein CFE44_13675 [Burkholderiales bacterium PBB4]|nr:MAG: hypothetical protein CFE44_13675 [Burkholderiales bacterium PBB4]
MPMRAAFSSEDESRHWLVDSKKGVAVRIHREWEVAQPRPEAMSGMEGLQNGEAVAVEIVDTIEQRDLVLRDVVDAIAEPADDRHAGSQGFFLSFCGGSWDAGLVQDHHQVRRKSGQLSSTAADNLGIMEFLPLATLLGNPLSRGIRLE